MVTIKQFLAVLDSPFQTPASKLNYQPLVNTTCQYLQNAMYVGHIPNSHFAADKATLVFLTSECGGFSIGFLRNSIWTSWGLLCLYTSQGNVTYHSDYFRFNMSCIYLILSASSFHYSRVDTSISCSSLVAKCYRLINTCDQDLRFTHTTQQKYYPVYMGCDIQP